MIKQAVFGSKRNHDALWLHPFGFGVGMQPARAGQRLNAGKVDVVVRPYLEGRS